MNNFFTHIEPKEIEFIENSISAENYLPSIDVFTYYASRELQKIVIPRDSEYHDLGNRAYKAFFLNAGDYVLVSKWQDGNMLSEVSTKSIFEFVDNCDYDIQIRNMSGDNIEVSYGFYYGD